MQPIKTDRHQKFVQVAARRVNALTDVVELLQALADRPQTYVYTPANARMMRMAWREQLDLLEQCFDPDAKDPKPDKVKHEFTFSLSDPQADPVSRTPERVALAQKYELVILPTNEKNARFLGLATKRMSRIIMELVKLMQLSSHNYQPSATEREALLKTLNAQYQATCALFDPRWLTQKFLSCTDPIEYRLYAANLNGRAGRNKNKLDLVHDALPDWADTTPIDVFAFNEVSLGECAELENELATAGYRTLHDPRDPSTTANTCALAISPRLAAGRIKLPVLYPKQPSGLDYLATLIPMADGRLLGIAAVRLHSFLSDAEIAQHKVAEDLTAATYQSLHDVALPELETLIADLHEAGAAEILFAGDFNHGRISTHGYANLDLVQGPASYQVQRDILAARGIALLTPPTGSSFFYVSDEEKKPVSAIDHLAVSAGIAVTKLIYDDAPRGALDHAGLTATFTVPMSNPDASSRLQNIATHNHL